MISSDAAAGTVVLFDWNGTVVLDADRAARSLNGVLIARGITPLGPAAFRREFHLPMADMFDRLGASDTAAAEIEWNTAMAAESTSVREGTAALRHLREAGIRLGVVSAAFESSVRADMKALDLDGLWDSVDAPAIDKIDVLRSRRGDEPRAYYLGDTVYDMRSARAAGFTPVGVDRGYTDAGLLRDAGAELMLASFDELRALIEVTAAVR